MEKILREERAGIQGLNLLSGVGGKKAGAWVSLSLSTEAEKSRLRKWLLSSKCKFVL